ncbi:MAG: hypothetical protein DID92_2727744209 [Candidatus Nitrotoga sp. SPKER]|nr:MAG: hypothetical protein DID92_2727744209 [Candidatus Nitrotoga sp. SPKER]
MRHWTPEERARQSMQIRKWRPWELATGPRTTEGKAHSSQNAFIHGAYSQEGKDETRRVTNLIRECKALLFGYGR